MLQHEARLVFVVDGVNGVPGRLAEHHSLAGVKAIVLVLGAGDLATMWEAVFADVGVALPAILNAVWMQNVAFR